MLQTLIKRNGEKEQFNAVKANGWLMRASSEFTSRINWIEIVNNARNTSPEEMTTQDWQMRLVTDLANRGNNADGWPYMRMAGFLYSIYLMKKIHGDTYPTLSEHLKQIKQYNLARELDYSEDDLDYIDRFIIDHRVNTEMTYFQVEQYYTRYSLRHRTMKRTFETPQFTMIRMAMAVAEGIQDKFARLEKVRFLYNELKKDTINPPTPNYSALGTNHFGMASCCLIAVGDTAESIAAGGLVSEMITLASAGVGIHMDIRGIGDPVDGGRVEHGGLMSYTRKFVGQTTASKQGSRGGALNVFVPIYHPEVEMMAKLQNPRTPTQAQERRVNVTIQDNAFFAMKAGRGEKYFTFTSYSAPDLYEAFFKADQTEFEALYAKYEADDSFEKNYLSAYDTAAMVLNQQQEISTLFENNPSAMNAHTPFKDVIRQSNLCVAPETIVVIKQNGMLVPKKIQELVGQEVMVFNGYEWSVVTVAHTGVSQLYKITLADGFEVITTGYHKFYTRGEHGEEIETRAIDLVEGQELSIGDENRFDWESGKSDDFISSFNTKEGAIAHAAIVRHNNKHASIVYENGWHYVKSKYVQPTVISVEKLDRIEDTYCFNEPIRHRGIFNGVYTGQCVEVMVPTTPWKDILSLYGDGNPENGETGICNIGSVSVHNLPFDINDPSVGYREHKAAVRAMQELIDYAIDNGDNRFPAIAIQARKRRNSAVGMSGVATFMAERNLKLNSEEGLRVWHALCERHAYAVIESALELGQERGNAEWMNRTKWPEGWLPIDTYKKTIDTVTPHVLRYNWENLRSRIIANGGIRFSSVIAHMPGEQSTRKGTGSNSVYALFNLYVDKSDGSNAILWCAKDNDLIGHQYQLAWDLSDEDVAKWYGVLQKFTDQGISADTYKDRTKELKVTSESLVRGWIARHRYGLKSKYYSRSKTPQPEKQGKIDIPAIKEPEVVMPVDYTQVGQACDINGACSL